MPKDLGIITTLRTKKLSEHANKFFQSVDHAIGSGIGFIENTLLKSTPATNITENENNFVVEIATPGIKKENLKIEIEGDFLTVSSSASNSTGTKGANYSKQEFSYAEFCRTFHLPKDVDSKNIKASQVDGVLKIEIAKIPVTVSKEEVVSVNIQ